MTKDDIAEIRLDGSERLCVRPATQTFAHIYRAAMEVGWDAEGRFLFSPKPREWSYLDWYRQILAAAKDEYGVELRITAGTAWRNVPAALRLEIEGEARLPASGEGATEPQDS